MEVIDEPLVVNLFGYAQCHQLLFLSKLISTKLIN